MRWRLGFGLAVVLALLATNQTIAGVLDASWIAPTTNTDGSALTDLASYRVYYSTSASPCFGPTFFSVASSTTTPSPNQTVNFRLTGLTTGSTYSVAVTALDTSGHESACSAPASAVAQIEIFVTPTTTVNFGNVTIGSSATQTFTVQSTRTGTVTGTVSVAAPFSIVSGSPFTLVGPGATATVTVQFTPTSTVAASGNVNFTADGDSLSRLVSGTGVSTGSTLTISKAGAGSGTVTSSPAGISCGATCSASFTNGTSVTLTAAAAADSTFTGWSGSGCSGTGTCTVAISAATSVTATFMQSSFALTVTKAGAGSGTVTSAPAGISCGATCSTSFTTGTVVTLTAAPAAGSTFTGWSGGCTGTGSCTVTMSAAQTVTATFALQSVALTVSKTGTGGGTITSAPAGISCGTTCSGSFASGTAVTLTATPAAGSSFTGWSGGGCTGIGTCTVTMSAATSVTATFALQSFALTVSKTGTGSGTVTSAPAGISCGTMCSGSFASGTAVTLTATPAAGSTFTGWSGSSCSGNGTCNLTVSAAQAVTATFNSAGVSGIMPSTIDLATPPASFTITGNGFADLGFGLPVVNFMRGTTLIAQARATALTGGTTLTVPFPTQATAITPNMPGLSAGPVQAQVWQQTSSAPPFTLIGTTTLTVNDTRLAPSVSGITPNPIDLATPPASFTIAGTGFADLGFGLPVVNFMRGTTLLAQARGTALTGSTTLTVPFPTQATALTPNMPGLSAGPVQAQVWQQTSSTPTFTLIGSATLTVTDTRPGTITPSTIDLATPPASFTIAGSGFANLGFGLPVVNFMRGTTLLAQARATALSGSTTLTVPFPTQATALTPNMPGLSGGAVQAQVWQQTGSNSFSLVTTVALTVTDTRRVDGIAPASINLAAPPATFTITGIGFSDLGYGLPVVNFMRGTTLLAQARATALTGGTTLTVPFPTQATALTANLPGLSVGPVQAQVWRQVTPGSFTLIGSADLTVSGP
jgi:Divergent InlB B-repeat domain/Cep192 domain 4